MIGRLELRRRRRAHPGGAFGQARVHEPEGFDADEYPIETTLRVSAKFKGNAELRVVERAVVVRPRREIPPPPTPVLRPDPTFLRVASRQPVKLVSGGAATHVRLWLDSSGGRRSWARRRSR